MTAKRLSCDDYLRVPLNDAVVEQTKSCETGS
jgi:hypothetical protein